MMEKYEREWFKRMAYIDRTRIEDLGNQNASLKAKLAKAVEIAELFSGSLEYDYHGNIIGDEERKAMEELEELTGGKDV